MKKVRQKLIADTLRHINIATQKELVNHLLEIGHKYTQATISRDLKQMKVTKVVDEHGIYRLRLPLKDSGNRIPSGYQALAFSGNMAVLKTRPAFAPGAASIIDALDIPEVLGTIAGDDTVFIVLIEGTETADIEEIIVSAVT